MIIVAFCLSRMAAKDAASTMGSTEGKSALPNAAYIKVAEEMRGCAERECHPAAKELLLDIERSFQRLAEIARYSDELNQERKYDRPFAFFGFFRGR